MLEIKQWLGDLTLNTILRVAAGKRFSATVDVSEENKSTKRQKTLREFFYYLSLFVPGVGWLDLGGYAKAVKKTAKDLDGTLEKLLEEHKKRRRVYYQVLVTTRLIKRDKISWT